MWVDGARYLYDKHLLFRFHFEIQMSSESQIETAWIRTA